jgi:hypothetical protein
LSTPGFALVIFNNFLPVLFFEAMFHSRPVTNILFGIARQNLFQDIDDGRTITWL